MNLIVNGINLTATQFTGDNIKEVVPCTFSWGKLIPMPEAFNSNKLGIKVKNGLERSTESAYMEIQKGDWYLKHPDGTGTILPDNLFHLFKYMAE
jgi:hypothetical protein